jgi:hypothetical protein
METDLKALHWTAKCEVPKAHSRGWQEHAMSKASGKRSQKVEVQIMFEPSRLEQDCLHKVYSYLIPVLHRRLASRATPTEVSAQPVVHIGERSMP